MSDGDAGIPSETGQTPVERNLSKEFIDASEVGRLVMNVVKERTEVPQFSVRRYTMPLLNQDGYSQETKRTVTTKLEQITDDDIKAAREASVILSVEFAAQIVGARPISNQVIEDSKSLEQIVKVVNRSAGFIIQAEASDPQIIIKAGRLALERRKGAVGLEEADKWDDQRVLSWTKESSNRARIRLKKILDAVDAYHRQRI